MSALRGRDRDGAPQGRRSRVPWGVAAGLLAGPARHGPVHGHPQGSRGRARSSGCSAPRRSSPREPPTGRRSWTCSAQAVTDRRRDPVRVPHRLGLRSRVRRPHRPRPAGEPDAASDDRGRQVDRDRASGRSASPPGCSPSAWRSARWSACRAGRPRTPSATSRRSPLAAILTIGLQTWAAFFAGVGRGFIAPLAWTVARSWRRRCSPSSAGGRGSRGRCRPSWPVPAAIEVEPVAPAAVAVVLLTVVGGLAATIAWWERADQTG